MPFHSQKSPSRDYGNTPCVFNIDSLALQNQAFRKALWTGTHLQITLMCLKPGESIGFEMHKDTDQLLKAVSGSGTVYMGNAPHRLNLRAGVDRQSAVLIPAGTYHDLKNSGRTPLKLYSVYAPPHHPFGTLQTAKEAEENKSSFSEPAFAKAVSPCRLTEETPGTPEGGKAPESDE